MFELKVVKVKSVKFPKKDSDYIEFEFDCGCWYGSKLKDYWRVKNIEFDKIIKKNTELRIWTIGWSQIIGFQVRHNRQWISAWCIVNDFRTKEQETKDNKDYNNFVEKEGELIAKWIDAGKTLKKIDELVSKDHSLNTYGYALLIGIKDAKNRKYAKKIRNKHNSKYNSKGKGVVNPALLSIEEK